MAKSGKSWLPSRNAQSGRFATTKEGMRDKTTVAESTQNGRGPDGYALSSKGKTEGRTVYRSAVSGKIELPSGRFITTVRKDVMDTALGRTGPRKK